ncbi:MAG: hypothetical protein NW237_11715 [Cyanobacteriota bacterium]|nr:hypothetical protein [Cyanobacteriota bacterium]
MKRTPCIFLASSLTLATSMASLLTSGIPVLAQTPAPPSTTLDGGIQGIATNPPAVLQELLERQMEAANQQNLPQLMATYSPTFEHADGLNFDQTEAALQTLWQHHPQLTYQAEIQSWQKQGSDLVATVLTEIKGSQVSERGEFQLLSRTTTLNRYRPNPEADQQLQLIEQKVLRESSSLTSGSAPPTVTLQLPESVRPGSTYSLSAVVDEPLGSNVLLGTAIEESITPKRYTDDASYPLEPLQAGGIFRQADAPSEAGSQWISVMLVGQSGIRLESRRVIITDRLLP